MQTYTHLHRLLVNVSLAHHWRRRDEPAASNEPWIDRCYLVQPIHEGRRLDRIERWFVMAFLLHGDAPMIRVGEVNQEAGHQHNLVVHHHHHHHRIGGHSREHPLGGIMECNAFVRLPWQGSDGAATDQDGLLNQVSVHFGECSHF